MEPRIADLARVQIARPLTKLLSLLPLAQRVSPPDIEVLHQLRVQCRRSEAAIRIFKPLLDTRRTSDSLGELRRIRRAVGEIRDWDVFIEFLQNHGRKMTVLERPGLHFLLAYALASRAAEEGRMREALAPIRLHKVTAVESFDQHLDLPAKSFAIDQLASVLKIVSSAFQSDDPSPEQLHDIRKKMKRLRYSVEIFEGIADPPLFKATKKEIARIQDHLGRYHDAYVFEESIRLILATLKEFDKSTWRQVSPGARALIDECKRASSDAHSAVMGSRALWSSGDFGQRLISLFQYLDTKN